MAIVAHLIEKELDPGDSVVDGVAAVVLGIDNAVDTTDAAVRARAVTVLKAAGFALPDGYFTKNRPVVTTWDAAGDVTVFNGRTVHDVIA